MNLLKTVVNKVSPVSIGNALERDRLFTLLGKEWPTTSFWLSGPGGSGKTTLIASYLKKEKIPGAWYQVDALDGDPATFFYYFSQSLNALTSVPEPLPLFTSEYLPHLNIFALRFFEIAFQRLSQKTWVIIDNFQDAPADSALEKIISLAVQQVPPHITLAILSRSNPSPAMARFLANRTMAHIHWGDLAFTRDELASFLLHSGQPTGSEEGLDTLYQLTKGWISGAILWLQHQDSILDFSAIPAGWAPENIFDYFAAEILEKLSPAECTFFFTTAFLPSMTIAIVEELTETKAGELLERLHRRNCFIEKRLSSVPIYQYHPLFRSFLLSQASRFFDPKTLLTIRSRTAGILERHGLFEEAMDLYATAKDLQHIEAIILKQAPSLIAQGRHAVLTDWIDLLPEERTAFDPSLLYWKGIALLTNNLWESSACCGKAYYLFSQHDDLPGRVLSWSAAVNIPFMLRYCFADLDQWIVEGEQLGKKLRDDSDPDIVARFSSGMLMALLQRNQSHDDFEKWQMRCEGLLDHCRDPLVSVDLMKNLCWSYAWMGKLRKGLNLEDRLRRFCEDENFSPLGLIILHHCLAVSCITRGEQRESLQLVTRALRIAQETGIHVFDFLILANYCCILLGTGQFEQIPVFFDKMRAALSPLGKLDQGEFHCLTAWYLMQIGQPTQAKTEVEIAVGIVEFCGSYTPIALTKVVQSQINLELGYTAVANELLEGVRSEPRIRRSTIIQWLVDLASADCMYVENRVAEAEQYCRSAFAFAREEGIGITYGLSNRRLGAVCAKALGADIETKTVREMIKRWQLKPPASESVSEQWPWPIRISTLGRFRIHCDGIPLVLFTKTPRKPLELLALLIAAGNNGLPRKKLADRLWPAADGDLAAQSLATTLHRLRRLLKNSDAVIHAGEQLLLNKDLVWIDSWHFQWLALQIEKTKDQTQRILLIEKALDIYAGPLVTGSDHLSMIVGYVQQLYRLWLQVLAAATPYFVENELPPAAKDALIKALMEKESADALVDLFTSSRKEDEQTSTIVGKIRQIASDLALAAPCGRTPKCTKL
jgi:LuxR family transcriptional regulator, maltose regulon positive regulatory protein